MTMAENNITARTRAALKTIEPIRRFFAEPEWSRRMGDPEACDFTIGNPHDMPPYGYVEALQRRIVPEHIHWYAYKTNESASREIVAASLRAWRGTAFKEEDIFVTTGSTAGLHVVIGAITGLGDEVLFMSPPWFQYEGMIIIAGGTPVRVKVDPKTYDLDLASIEKAITEKTRAVIINSPHNPTGKIYPPQTLERLAGILEAASKRYRRTIYLVSDESYSRIVFDGRVYRSPTEFYASSFLVYTYGKVLLTPGQRIGFIALPPGMPGKEEIRDAVESLQMLCGWAFPNALLQHAFADLDRLSVDIPHLQKKRDRMITALREMGYETSIPEGTFYILVRSPLSDDAAFVRLLSSYKIFCIPGALMDLPGWFRISLTANDDMIERAIPKFGEALRAART
jgi:aspartate aminotransferase